MDMDMDMGAQIYKDLDQQIQAAKYFIQVETMRCLMAQKLQQNEEKE